jgi:CheY-like chemotaxis protein
LHIFEPTLGDESADGSGLALPTAYRIVEHCGGLIAVEGAAGLGTTFTVYLPALGDADAPARVADQPAEGFETILVVEDEEIVRAVMRQFLERQGYEVLAAGDARQALAICEQRGGRIDLLVTDLVMPGIDGRQLAKQVRSLRSDVAVLFTSGYPEDSELVQEIVGQGQAFEQKPFTRDAFLRRVREVLDGPRAPIETIAA